MPTLAKKENELIDSCDYSCETSSHASGESWLPRANQNATH